MKAQAQWDTACLLRARGGVGPRSAVWFCELGPQGSRRELTKSRKLKCHRAWLEDPVMA